VLVVVALVFGGIYQAFSQFLPAEWQQNIVVFVTGAFGSAKLFYDFIWKKIKK